MAVQVVYEHGTLVVPSLPDGAQRLRSLLTWDERVGRLRAPGRRYRELITGLRELGVPYVDEARKFEPIPLSMVSTLNPFPHQQAALEGWLSAGRRGVVELPTGSGKTILGVLAAEAAARPTLVVVPTLELLGQWKDTLEHHLGCPVGVIGGGQQERREVTVITYDSAALQAEFLGNRFGLLIFDECHHLPSEGYRFIAESSIAPFRLGLTATLARPDGKEKIVLDLVGPLVHQVGIEELEGNYLAPYRVETISVELHPDEAERYAACRQTYLQFLRASGIDLRRKDAWPDFVVRAHRSPEGREAFQAYRTQRRIALASRAKMDALWTILLRHRTDRVLIFTDNTETVYRISRRFFLPALTHQTRPSDRRALLKAFSEGSLRVLVTAQVLNEGVDVPEATVGVVLSGSGSVREHVQRLGRILRRRAGKRAVLYEVVSDASAELGISERRRQHAAYERVDEAVAPPEGPPDGERGPSC